MLENMARFLFSPALCAMLGMAFLSWANRASCQQEPEPQIAASTGVLEQPHDPRGIPSEAQAAGFVDAELEEREDKAEAWILHGRVGLGVSSAAFVGGIGVLMAGSIDRAFCRSDYDEGCGNGMIPAGSVMMVVGGAAIAASAFVLRRGKRSKRDLERKRVETALRLSPASASVVMRF